MIALVSLDRASFEHLLKRFKKAYDIPWRIGKRGRPVKFPLHHYALGAILMFYSTQAELKLLCTTFDAGPSIMSRTIQKAELEIFQITKKFKNCRIQWPSFDQQAAWASLVSKKEPEILGRFGFIDGKNYPVADPSDIDLQNAMHNGWLMSTLITGTLCFGVDGCIIWGKHNFCGSWNDADTSKSCQEKLADPTKTLNGHGLLADSAFPVRDNLFGRIMTPLKDGDIMRAHPKCHAILLRRSSSITRLRQAAESAEWGMGAVEKPFKRLLSKLPCNAKIRNMRLQNIHRLYNYRVPRTGISQIKNFFNDD